MLIQKSHTGREWAVFISTGQKGVIVGNQWHHDKPWKGWVDAQRHRTASFPPHHTSPTTSPLCHRSQWHESWLKWISERSRILCFTKSHTSLWGSRCENVIVNLNMNVLCKEMMTHESDGECMPALYCGLSLVRPPNTGCGNRNRVSEQKSGRMWWTSWCRVSRFRSSGLLWVAAINSALLIYLYAQLHYVVMCLISLFSQSSYCKVR